MSAAPRLDVYYDYGSPFAYLASELLPALAARHGAALVWKPLAIGALDSYVRYSPLKGKYVVLDVQPKHIQADWFFVPTVTARTDEERFAKGFVSEAGAPHLVEVGTPAK